MRQNLTQSLDKNHIEPSSLSRFQRVLLTTDGSVTQMIESYFFEKILLVKMSENIISTDQYIGQMELPQGAKVIQRKIFIQGKISRRNYIYAESIISLERLEENFRQELLKTQTPIGKIWKKQRIENFKEIVKIGKTPARELSKYFLVAPESNLLFRNYCVFTNRKSVMMITEYFPESYSAARWYSYKLKLGRGRLRAKEASDG